MRPYDPAALYPPVAPFRELGALHEHGEDVLSLQTFSPAAPDFMVAPDTGGCCTDACSGYTSSCETGSCSGLTGNCITYSCIIKM